MRLKYKLGPFISFIIITMGLILMIGGIDKEGLILYAGLALFSFSFIFFLVKNKLSKNIQPNWLKFIGAVLMVIGVFIHFLYQTDTKLLVLALSALLNPFQKDQEQPRSTFS